MFGFFKRKSRQPDWSLFMPADYRACLKLIEDELRSSGRGEFRIEDGIVVFADERDQQMGLQNLMQMCHRAGREHWLEIIRDHFQAMAEPSLGYDPNDFEAVKSQLTVRVYSDEILEAAKEHLLYRRHIPGTASVLCVDLPKSIQTVSRGDIGRWPMNYDELFALAMDNTLRVAKVEQDAIDLGDGVAMKVLLSEDTYAATFALRLERFPELIAEHGSLVALPTASIVLVQPFSDASIIPAIHKMIAIADSQFEQGPQSISNKLYWRQRGGAFIDLPWEIKGKELIFKPPQEFNDVLTSSI